ncbi:hypothetical protein V6C27_14665 [Peptococcaceae bacterium 1198_IL3148]
MKLDKCVLLIILISFIYVSVAFAAVPTEALINQQSLDTAKEKSKIEEAINLSKMNPKQFLVDKKNILNRNELTEIKSATELEYGNAYKVVSINKNVIQALLDGTNLATILQTTPYYWEFPVLFRKDSVIKPVASFKMAKHNNEWQVVEIGGYLSPEQINFSSNTAELNNILKNKSLGKVDSFIHFRWYSIHSDFLYISTEGKEYFVPLIHGRDELYGLRNKAVYTRDELVSAIGPIIKKNLEVNSPITGYPSS